MVRESEERPWADLCPELLNAIYEKLPPSAARRRAGFGSVCRAWRQFHAAVPLPLPCYPHSYRSGHRLCRITLAHIGAAIPAKIRHQLYAASIAFTWQSSSGWLLLRHSHEGPIFCCFNPLLPWPQSYIKLPTRFAITPPPFSRDSPPPMIKAAFSSDPAGPDDWTVLVIGARPRTFSTFRRGGWGWRNYHYYESWYDNRAGINCVAVGFREGRFLCLFGTGDVLIFGSGERRMLVMYPHPASVSLDGRHNGVVTVEVGGGEGEGELCAVVRWELVGDGHGGGRGKRWWLAGVERRGKEEAERVAEELVEEGNWGVFYVRENSKYKIWRTWNKRREGCVYLFIISIELMLFLVFFNLRKKIF